MPVLAAMKADGIISPVFLFSGSWLTHNLKLPLSSRRGIAQA